MARMTSMEALEKRIEKAQEKVSRAKKQYDDAITVLSDVKDWCKENGFKIISCEGEGNDSGFEPDSVRRWIKY